MNHNYLWVIVPIVTVATVKYYYLFRWRWWRGD